MTEKKDQRKVGPFICKVGVVIPLACKQASEVKLPTLVHHPIQDAKFKTFAPGINNYVKTKDAFVVPKHFGVNLCNESLSYHVMTATELDIPEKVRFVGDMTRKGREFQNEAFTKISSDLENLENSGAQRGLSGMIVMQPGQGKTVLALRLAVLFGKKTLIMVNKIPLLDQWVEEIERFVPEARIKVFRGQLRDISDADIVVSVLQSVALKDDVTFKEFASFGTVFFDEAHHMSSQMFSKAIFKCCSSFMIGLSATPTRADGLQSVLDQHLGPVLYASPKNFSGKISPSIRRIKINNQNIEPQSDKTGNLIFAKLITDIVSSDQRNTVICDEIMRLSSDLGRKLLVMSDRRTHVHTVQQMLIRLGLPEDDIGLFIGGLKSEQLTIARSRRVILATYKAFAEGVSEKDLNTLVMITPKKYDANRDSGQMEQIVGRIFRKEYTSDMVPPLVVEFIDSIPGCPVFLKQSRQRHEFYSMRFPSAVVTTVDSDENKSSQSVFVSKGGGDRGGDRGGKPKGGSTKGGSTKGGTKGKSKAVRCEL